MIKYKQEMSDTMKAIGIIAEYNPFHNGHLYHLNKVKEKYPNHIIVLVMNGNFKDWEGKYQNVRAISDAFRHVGIWADKENIYF